MSILSAACILTIAAATAGACGGDGEVSASARADSATSRTCNGFTENCARPFNQVVFPTAHNAMSSAADGWFLPNQPDGVAAQLAAGVRGFMLDVHPYDGDDPALKGKAMLCHGVCAAGSRPLAATLTDIKGWLDGHPDDAIVIVFEDHVAEAAIAADVAATGLWPRCIAHSPGSPWPSLAALIDEDRRVLIMTESGTGKLPWNHAYQAIAFDTPYAAESPAQLSCDILRGKPGNDLFVVNHFLTKGLTSHAELAKLANHQPLLGDRVRACELARKHRANLIAVDWYSEGALFAVAAAIAVQPQGVP